MTSRFLALALIAALAVGCGDSESTSTGATAPGDMDEFETLAYAAGFQAAQGVKADSASFKFFEFSTFEEGFRDGLAQDSARVAYLFGYELGNRIASDTVSGLDAERFLAGFRLGLEQDSSGIPDEELQRISGVVQDSISMRQLRARAATDTSAAAQLRRIRENAGTAQTFLAEVAQRDGIVETGSGLLYSVEEEGTGESPQNPTDVVVVNYVGKLADGTVFDQSTDGTGMLGLSEVAEGFREGVADMKVGGKRTLYIPPALAFGQQGLGPIPPNAALVFEVELLDVMTLQEASQPTQGL